MAAQQTIKMLSIDDKTVTTDLDRAGYRKMGVVVRPAATFDEANKLLKADPVDLIVINMDFKGVDAVNVTRHLKSQADFAAIPIILTSVQTSAKVRNSAMEAGADLFVEQPLPRQYFIEKLKQLLAQSTRTTERIDLETQAHFAYNGQNLQCPIGDLSISGILLATDLEMADGAKIELEFEVPGNKKPVKVEGIVVRTIHFSPKHPERSTGVGIRFVDFNGDSQKRLERYIEKTAHADSPMKYYL